jgi:nitrous oxide reductase
MTLMGCDKDQPQSTTFTVVTDDPKVNTALPAVRQACPGLDTYSSQFANTRVQQQFRTAIVFDIPDTARLPDAYKAAGHTCYLEIDSAGKTLFIEKQACKSVCLDQLDTPQGQLSLPLAEARP